MKSKNIYNSTVRAESYSKLEFTNTYYLAYRDLPQIILQHAKGQNAVDFGCGTGRSTRFLKDLGFDVVGIDNSIEMLNRARENDNKGHYQLVSDGEYAHLGRGKYDLISSIFTFDNITDKNVRQQILGELAGLLKTNGKVVLLDSCPEIYIHEWASFSTVDFPENQRAKSGEIVKVIMKDVEDKRPVEDFIWFHEDYLELFSNAGLKMIRSHKPLGKTNEPYPWITETKIAPWIIYVLKKNKININARRRHLQGVLREIAQ